MDTYENLKCLCCLDQIPEGQDIAIPLDYEEPGSESLRMIAYICWYCANEMGASQAKKEAIERIICARLTRLKYQDDEKSFKP